MTAQSSVQLMESFAARPDAEQWQNALPIMGVDGSIATVQTDSPAKGQVFAKTGTLGAGDLLNNRLRLETKALGGYIIAKSGRKLAVSIIVNQAMFNDIQGVFAANEDLGEIATSIYDSYSTPRVPRRYPAGRLRSRVRGRRAHEAVSSRPARSTSSTSASASASVVRGLTKHGRSANRPWTLVVEVNTRPRARSQEQNLLVQRVEPLLVIPAVRAGIGSTRSTAPARRATPAPPSCGHARRPVGRSRRGARCVRARHRRRSRAGSPTPPIRGPGWRSPRPSRACPGPARRTGSRGRRARDRRLAHAVVVAGLDRESAPEDALVTHDGGAGANGCRQPLVGIDGERVVGGQVAEAVPHTLVEHPQPPYAPSTWSQMPRSRGDAGKLRRSGRSGRCSRRRRNPRSRPAYAPPRRRRRAPAWSRSRSMVPSAVQRDLAQAAPAQPQHADRAADHVVGLGGAVDARLDHARLCRPATGCRPSRSPACWRAAPMPTRFAVEPPEVNVPTEDAGKPSSSMSQRIARSSTKLPAVAHQRWATATA